MLFEPETAFLTHRSDVTVNQSFESWAMEISLSSTLTFSLYFPIYLRCYETCIIEPSFYAMSDVTRAINSD